MKKIYFATKNDYKVAEVASIMKQFGIHVEKLGLDKEENKEKTIEEVAHFNAERFARKHKVPVVVEDTGFFYNTYANFPGSNPKLMFNILGYRGLLKLLEGESDRNAHFRSAVAYSDGSCTEIFVGRLDGAISEKVEADSLDVMPYERIFIPSGHEKVIAFMTRDEKNQISHRADAFRQLGRWLTKDAKNATADAAKTDSEKNVQRQSADSLDDNSPDTESWQTNSDAY